jgi:hypothetical protein
MIMKEMHETKEAGIRSGLNEKYSWCKTPWKLKTTSHLMKKQQALP